MIIHVTNTTAEVEATDQEREWLYEYLSWPDNSYVPGRRRKEKRYFRLFNMILNTFPAGFTRMVIEHAKLSGIPIQIVDRRVQPGKPDPTADLGWLRPYQREAVEAVVKRSRGVIKMVTGAGKTEVAIGLAERLPCKWLFLAHRANLVVQAAERYQLRTGKTAGVIGDGRWEVEEFTAATFQSLYARIKKQAESQDYDRELEKLLESVEGVLVDECHTLPAESFYRVIMSMPNAYYRVGVSATPLSRADKRSMLTIGATGSLLYEVPAQVLIDAGVLARPKIYFVKCEQISSRRSWHHFHKECITGSASRNDVVLDMVAVAAKPCMVFVNEVSHGKRLESAIRAAGTAVEYVDGGKNTPQRKAAITRLERGDTDVLVCTAIFNEGVDIPCLRSVVIAAGGASSIAAIQRVGRGMRKDVGKDQFEVWDVMDYGHKWLVNHTKERIRAYEAEGYIVDDAIAVDDIHKIPQGSNELPSILEQIAELDDGGEE